MTATESHTQPLSFVYPDPLTLGEQNGDGFHQELLRGLTHKLNNMLAIIQGFSSLILMNKEMDPAVLENLQHIKEASVNISSLGERIRAAGGCAKVNLQPLQLSEYLDVVQGTLHEPFKKLSVPFDLEVAPGLPAVKVDPTKLKELLLELLKNAAEACQKNGGKALMQVVTPGAVSAIDDGRVDILISNTGSPIPAEKLQEIFKPFSGSKNSHHLGLGLTIAAMLAHQMNIQLGVNSSENATTFWVSVPIA